MLKLLNVSATHLFVDPATPQYLFASGTDPEGTQVVLWRLDISGGLATREPVSILLPITENNEQSSEDLLIDAIAGGAFDE